ncbi:hypothetical protein [Alteromonas halophila]|uniref:Uncharacterized protein n=1 Tax=Alteromonas halophila TaxID=516698 RepID=A0A918JG92_9ALTE|nr:hypothetical protein [Alteromonas halophila]GGW79516.1 hypothetical protein GCM10007391_10380 [Alteromonas halophila]
MMITRSLLTVFAGVLLVGALIAVTVMWIEAKKEVMYLCGNFSPGVTKKSVFRQLDTANLLTYDTRFTANGSTTIARSPLHLDGLHCRIYFTKDERVAHAQMMLK